MTAKAMQNNQYAWSLVHMEATMPSFNRLSRIALTVRDMRASAGWYERVLGFDFVKEFQVAPGHAGIPRILLLHQPSGLLLSMCGHPGRTGDAFDPLRTGLDHIAFEVADRAELTSWSRSLPLHHDRSEETAPGSGRGRTFRAYLPSLCVADFNLAWRAQLDNERGTLAAQRNRPRGPAVDRRQCAFLHVTYASHR